MKKNKNIFIGFFILCLVLSAQGSSPKKETGGPITDQAGRAVSIIKVPKAIISLSPSNTEILFAIGAGDQVVGVTDFCNYPPEAAEKESIGGFADMSLEKIISLSPDLVFAANLHITKLLPSLEAAGLNVVVTDPQTVEEIFQTIELVGKITGHLREAEELRASLIKKKGVIAEKVKGVTPHLVFWELSNDLWTVGAGTFIDDVITLAGGKNLAGDIASSWLQLNNEIIVEKNPEVIILADHSFGVSIGVLDERPGWDNLSAVKNERVMEITEAQTDIVSRPGPRVIEAIELVARFLHPEVF